MGLPLRILLGLGLPLAFVAAVLAMAWAAFDGPPVPWNALLAIALGLGALAAGFVYVGFLSDREVEAAAPFAFLAAVALVIATLIGVNQRALYDHGHDVACRLTSINQKPNAQGQTYIQYGVDCDGGAPTLIDGDVVPTGEAKVGLPVVLRYDADGGALTALARDATDGHVALTVAAAAAGVLLLIGVGSAVIVAVIE